MPVTVNQQTIANHLNVSVATVSKALRDASDVSEATRTLVLETARQMGYESSSARRRQQGNEHKFIGVICRTYQEGALWGHDSYLGGLREVSADLNVSLVAQEVLFSRNDLEAFEPRNQPPAMRNNELAGYLVLGQWSPEFMQLLTRKAPCIAVPYTIPGIAVDQIGLDHQNSILDFAQHLHDMGHRRIGYVGRCSTLTWATERFAGFVNAVSQLSMDYRPEDVFDVGQAEMLEEGHEAFWHDLIERVDKAVKSGVTAFICSSDWPGNQLHKGLVERGYDVPGDISLTGFDDTETVTLGMPPLTSTRLPRHEMGEAALKRLMYRIGNPKAAVRRVLFPCEIVNHETTGPVRHRLSNTSK